MMEEETDIEAERQRLLGLYSKMNPNKLHSLTIGQLNMPLKGFPLSSTSSSPPQPAIPNENIKMAANIAAFINHKAFTASSRVFFLC